PRTRPAGPGGPTGGPPRGCSSPATTARSSPASGCLPTAASSSPDMPASRGLSVRGTPIHMMQAGAGPPLLFLPGAGGAPVGLPSQERLAESLSVYFPSHPGHGGSPAAEWIEHISDLAFHYLALLHRLHPERGH